MSLSFKKAVRAVLPSPPTIPDGAMGATLERCGEPAQEVPAGKNAMNAHKMRAGAVVPERLESFK
jgi:hypothetical protein